MLNKQDIAYRDNSSVRIRTRGFIAFIVGLFANWPWLIAVIAVFSVGEIITMNKILNHSRLTGEILESTPKEKGMFFGQSFIAGISAGVTTFLVAGIIKVIRDQILACF
jgi:hypothetical protein